MTISAVAFDLGGVLTDPPFAGLEAYAQELELPPDAFSRYFRGDPTMAQLETGAITSREFFKYVCVSAEAAHGCRVDIHELARAASHGERLVPAMLDLVGKVKRRASTALLTNNVKEAGWRETFPYHLFDVCIDSSEAGVRKPDPGIFHALIDALNRPPEEIAFFDDFEENIGPAAALGIRAIQFTSIDDCRRELGTLGALDPVAS